MAPLTSWLNVPSDSDFSLANLPFGIIYSKNNPNPRPAVAIGTYALDLPALAAANGFSALPEANDALLTSLSQPTLNTFASLGRPTHRAVRTYLQSLLSSTTPHASLLKDLPSSQKSNILIPAHEFKNTLPMQIGDYTDFFAGINHAFNAGTLFRGPANALQPNYKHIPVGYHSRSSSIVVSGTPVRRPNGQILLDPTAEVKTPTVGPSRRLDIELELGCFLCKGNELGERIKVEDAEEAIFGYVLLNDWSARDIQAWEYVPLGPFNGKNFSSTISPWIVLADALEPFRTPKLEPGREVQGYLQEKREDTIYDISLSVDLTTAEGDTTTLSNVSAKHLYWSFPQMIAHHSLGGCNMRTGDLLGSGTITGSRIGSPECNGRDMGSLLEMSEGGKKEIMLAGMHVRKFLMDGDSVVIRGVCEGPEGRVGFGSCEGRVVSAEVL